MTSIIEAIRHYQRRIDKYAEDEAILLHCLERLNKLPITAKYLQKTRVGRTVNSLRKHDGKVGHTASALVAKWKRKVEADISVSSGEREQLLTDDTENIEPSIMNKFSDGEKNDKNLPSNNDSVINSPESGSRRTSDLEKSQEKSDSSGKKSSKNSGEGSSRSHSSSSSSKSTDKREDDGRKSNHSREERKKTKRRECEKRNDKHGSDLIDIDYTMGTSFAEALGMLDMPSTSKARKLTTDKPSTSNASLCGRPGKRSLSDETPILLTKRPRLEPPLDIAVEMLPPSTINHSEVMRPHSAFRQPQRQTTQMSDAETISYSTTSRSTKTKVFSGNRAESKCKVVTLFELCIRILQDNIDLLEFIGGVPFDILRPVLERTTYEQLITLEDYNPYLMEDTHCLWEQHCKLRFRSKSRQELETWRDMYMRCLDEEQTKFNSLTATIKLSKERQTKTAYVDTNAPRNTKANQVKGAVIRVPKTVVDSSLQVAAKSKEVTQIKKRAKKSNDDPDWTPTTWYRTLYKKPQDPKPRDPKPPKPPIKKSIDMLRYDRAKALEQKKRGM